MTGKTTKWLRKNEHEKFLHDPYPKCKRFTDTEAYVDKNGNISFAFVDFPIRFDQKTVKVNKCVNNKLT